MITGIRGDKVMPAIASEQILINVELFFKNANSPHTPSGFHTRPPPLLVAAWPQPPWPAFTPSVPPVAARSLLLRPLPVNVQVMARAAGAWERGLLSPLVVNFNTRYILFVSSLRLAIQQNNPVFCASLIFLQGVFCGNRVFPHCFTYQFVLRFSIHLFVCQRFCSPILVV